MVINTQQAWEQNKFTSHAKNAEQRNFLKSVFKLHKIRFEVAGEGNKPYDREFTEMVLRAEEGYPPTRASESPNR